MLLSGRKAETIFHEVLSLWTLYGKRFRHRRIRSGQVFRRDKTAGAGDYLVYLGGWTRYGSRPRPEGTPSSVDRSNTQRSVAPSDKGSPTSTSGPPVALRSARIYRGRLLDQQVIPTLGYSAPATRPPHGALGSEGGRPRATRRVRSSDGRGLGGGDSGAPPSADATFCRRKDFQPRTDPLRGRKGLAPRPRRRRHAARGVHRGVAGTRILKREDSRADAARRDALTCLSVTFSFAIDGTGP